MIFDDAEDYYNTMVEMFPIPNVDLKKPEVKKDFMEEFEKRCLS